MKIFSLFFTFSFAIDDFLLFSLLGNSGSNSQNEQMSTLLPLLTMIDADTDLLMTMMMSGGTSDMNQLLPLLLRSDDSGDTDMLTTFMLLSTIQGDCNTNTNDAMSNLLHFLLFSNNGSSLGSSSDSLMTMLLFSTMSGGEGMSFKTLLMLDLFSEDGSRKRRSGDDGMDDILTMVLLSSMSGGMNSQSGFDNSFNLLLPMLLMNDTDTDSSQMLVLMMAMQSAAPETGMGSNMLLPLLLMDDSGNDNNESILFYMMMFGAGNNGGCNKASVKLPQQIVRPVVTQQAAPQQPVVVYQQPPTNYRTGQQNYANYQFFG